MKSNPSLWHNRHFDMLLWHTVTATGHFEKMSCYSERSCWLSLFFFRLLTFFCRTDGPLSRWRVEQTDLCQSDGFVEIWGTNFFTSIWKGHRRLPKFFRLRKTIFKRYLYQGVSLNTFKLKHSKHDVKNIYFRVKTRTSNN